MQDIIKSGPPSSLWLPGFFSMNSFVNAVTQKYARQMGTPMDDVKLDIQVLDQKAQLNADDNVIIHGLIFRGCRWNPELHCIAEPTDRVRHSFQK
jgi:dynein heavy chain, axonemal